MKEINYEFVIEILAKERDSLVRKLKSDGNEPTLVSRKSEIDAAIESLRICQNLQLSHLSKIMEIPPAKEAFGYYLLVETDEMGNYIKPLEYEGYPIELTGHELIVNRPLELGKYYIKT
jgi:hypothetical protein